MAATVNVNDRTVVHASSGGMVAGFPDVCKTPSPSGPLPVPYPNVARSADTAGGSRTVKADGNSIMLEGSSFGKSTGNEAGSAGGVASMTTRGKAEFINFSLDVKVEGKGVPRLGDMMVLNKQSSPNTPPFPEVQPPCAVFIPPEPEENDPLGGDDVVLVDIELAGAKENGIWIYQYVNLEGASEHILQEIPPERAGRRFTLQARVSPKKENVTIVFELAPEPGNVDPDAPLTITANGANEDHRAGLGSHGNRVANDVTNAEGEACVDVILSPFGGDKFILEVYRKNGAGDPDRKKYCFLTRRRLYYQLHRFGKGSPAPGRTGVFNEIPGFDMAPVTKELLRHPHGIELVKAGVKAEVVQRHFDVHGCQYTDDVAASAKDGYDATLEPFNAHVVLVNRIVKAKTQRLTRLVRKDRSRTIVVHEAFLDETKAYGEDWFLDAWCKWPGDEVAERLDPSHFRFVGAYKIEINLEKLPSGPPAGARRPRATVTIRYRCVDGDVGGLTMGNQIWIAYKSPFDNEHYPNGVYPDDGRQGIAIHELGHALGMVPAYQSSYYQSNGGHCSTSKLGCLMYASTDGTSLDGTSVALKFCDVCTSSLRLLPMKLPTPPQ